MMADLGMKDHKECILSLVNLGICHQLEGSLEKAMKLYQEALNIAERELGEDHKRKVYVKIQMAYWHKVKGNMKEASALKDDAVKMSDKLALPDNEPRNKFLLHKIQVLSNTTDLNHTPTKDSTKHTIGILPLQSYQ